MKKSVPLPRLKYVAIGAVAAILTGSVFVLAQRAYQEGVLHRCRQATLRIQATEQCYADLRCTLPLESIMEAWRAARFHARHCAAPIRVPVRPSA